MHIYHKVFPYLFRNIGPRADPGVQEVSPQVTEPSTWRPLLSARPAVTFLADSGYQIILLGDRGTCVWAACPRLLPGSRPDKIRIHDFLGHERILYYYATQATAYLS